MATSTTIWVSRGRKKYVGGTITETTGKDISGDTIKVALGPDSPPGPPPLLSSAVTPTVDTPGATNASRVVKLLIDNSTTLATGQWLYAWITDNPEVEPIKLAGPYRIA